MLNRKSYVFVALACLGLSLSLPGMVHAQFGPGADAAAREQRRQEERLNAIRQEQERKVDVLGAEPAVVASARLPESETPCFPINRVQLVGEEARRFSWLLKSAAGPLGNDPPQGRCLGAQGINLVLKRLQNALIANGYVTSRVVAAEQDLKGGELAVSVLPGRIHAIHFAPGTKPGPRLWAALPIRPGEVLNLRDIEQGLENLKNPPTSDATIKIVPATVEGESDLLITYHEVFPLRGVASLDDSGTKSTGKYQASVTIAYDNPMHLSDVLYATLSHDLGSRSGQGTSGQAIHYAVPFGYWNASAHVDSGRYYQTVAGAFQNYVYSGRTTNADVRLARLVHRDRLSKTTVALGAFQRTARNFIDDVEIGVQRRRTAGWMAALNHRHYLGASLLDATLSYRRGTGAFGAIAAPEDAFGEGTSRYKIFTVDATFATPFTVLGKPMQYQLNLRGQLDKSRLTAPERFVIGGRYTVRGFDGETVLSAERGWLARNDISLDMAPNLKGYVGVDYGRVGGPTSDLLVGKSLAGAVVGVRGGLQALRYDIFLGVPLHKPSGFAAASAIAGFNLSYGF